jgi:hypothetical protein
MYSRIHKNRKLSDINLPRHKKHSKSSSSLQAMETHKEVRKNKRVWLLIICTTTRMSD